MLRAEAHDERTVEAGRVAEILRNRADGPVRSLESSDTAAGQHPIFSTATFPTRAAQGCDHHLSSQPSSPAAGRTWWARPMVSRLMSACPACGQSLNLREDQPEHRQESIVLGDHGTSRRTGTRCRGSRSTAQRSRSGFEKRAA